jgi:HAMP domain-containing protein/two-component sensor histidine kinase/HPt (histidine-containing phosphotransfer) domain-containing protein
MATTRSGIARKLLAVCLVFSLPIVVMFVLMTRAKLGEIEFGEKELAGDAYQRPLEEAFEHISRHRRLWTRLRGGDSSLMPALQAEERAVASALAHVQSVDRTHGETLQFTADGLGLRKRTEFTAADLTRRWNAHLASLSTASSTEAQAGYKKLVQHVRTMITHSGDTSNLILDPDLDSYYLMDVTLLTLPQMEDRIQEIAVDVHGVVASGRVTPNDRIRLSTLAAFLQQADWDRVAASTTTAFNEDPNFYGVSPSLQRTLTPHVTTAGTATKRVVNGLHELSATDAPVAFDGARFQADIERLSSATFAFHRAAFDEEDRLIEIRLDTFERSLWLGISLGVLSVLVSGFFAFRLASDIVRRVRRISAVTDAFAKGDMGARVGNAGTDELGELGNSFDDMTDRIGGLTAEVRKRADELEHINTGLERIVGERTRELEKRNDAFRLILDHAHDGMLTVDLEGRISAERSAILDRWLGTPVRDQRLPEYLGAGDPTLTAELRLGLEELAADVMPMELTLDQLPREISRDGRHLRFTYQPILENEKIARLLVVLSDVTSELEGRRAAAMQEETLRIFHACQRDRSGFLDFFVDAREIVEKIKRGERRPLEVGRLVHTLKGNCAMFGVLSMSGLCHDIETNMADGGSGISPNDVVRLDEAWNTLSTTVSQIMGDDAARRLEVADEEYASIVDAIAAGAPRREILEAIARWKLEPAERRLGRFAERVRSTARRLGKDVEVTIEANDVRLCAETWSPVWNTLSHVIRNAIDHGLETQNERVQNGKPPVGNVTLRTRVEAGRVAIEVADDGRGVAWDVVAKKAQALKLPYATREDLVEAIFTDGVSTKDVATDLSGRGVGMAAVREACAALGGAVEIESEPLRGTTVRFTFPERMMGGKAMASLMVRPIAQSMVPVA